MKSIDTTRAIDPKVRIGHVHLKVADLERALRFYFDVLGFELTQRYGSQAAFVSAQSGRNTRAAQNRVQRMKTKGFDWKSGRKALNLQHPRAVIRLNREPSGLSGVSPTP